MPEKGERAFDDNRGISTEFVKTWRKKGGIIGWMDTQVVYIEYALLENAFLDGILLFLALRYSGCERSFRLYLAAGLGGVLALVYPLLVLPDFWGAVYKLATGGLLPIMALKKEKGRKTLLCVSLFFAFSFLVAGGVFAFSSFVFVKGEYWLEKLPLSSILALFLAGVCFAAETAKRVKRRREQTEFFVECAWEEEGVEKRAKGFIDTGNRVRHFGSPVCFVTPELFVGLRTKKRGYTRIKTVAGEREIPLIKIKKLRITQGGQTHIINGVYVSPSPVLCDREYEILLGAWACA
ncbi:MAG: sigma-E processing peptidase SpoIIGA [Clostridia bacterium]|nr:sigma-E processing peptidase SpoIIGA [Clostridia bacterium]